VVASNLNADARQSLLIWAVVSGATLLENQSSKGFPESIELKGMAGIARQSPPETTIS
jgi:hypothetical protein